MQLSDFDIYLAYSSIYTSLKFYDDRTIKTDIMLVSLVGILMSGQTVAFIWLLLFLYQQFIKNQNCITHDDE